MRLIFKVGQYFPEIDIGNNKKKKKKTKKINQLVAEAIANAENNEATKIMKLKVPNATRMKVLIACEESQAVCREFRNIGHEAYSCDLYKCSGGHPEWHINGDVLQILNGGKFTCQDGTPHFVEKWDLIIAHPPCTDLAVSGARHFERKIKDGTQQKSIDFFMKFTQADCDKIAIENPIGIMSTNYRKPDQIIQPYQFGDEFSKSTCLWLKGLPKLVPTKIVGTGEWKEWIDKKGRKKRQPMWFFEALKTAKTKEERSKLRSKTFPGIAKAMAEQWG